MNENELTAIFTASGRTAKTNNPQSTIHNQKSKMLDTDTKRRIDTARDILVGKVPDPKSQVCCHAHPLRLPPSGM